ncbi:hypothetical protein ACO3VM_06385 [Methanocaldococcus sp. 10A]
MKKFISLLGMILCVLGMLSIVSAYGDNGPLYINYIEKYNITANATVEGVMIESYNITGYIIINNTANDINDTLYDVWIAVNISNNVSPLSVDYTLTTVPKADLIRIVSEPPSYTGLANTNANTYIHIPILPNNSWVVLKFGVNVSSLGEGVPIIVSETYSTTKVPAQRDWNFTIYINLSRNTTALPSSDSEVYVELTKYLSNSTSDYGNGNWTFLNITKVEYSTGSYVLWDGPYFTGPAKDSLNWTGIILNNSQNASINITINTSNIFFVNRSNFIILADYGFAVIKFNFSGTRSNTTILGVYATGKGTVQAYKEGPYYNSSTGTFNIWYERANFTNLAKTYSFNLTSVNLWAINGSDPTNVDPFNNPIPGSRHEFVNPLSKPLNPGKFWNTSKYSFTFEDVPVVWANCTFKVVDNNITLRNYSIQEYDSKYGSSYIIIEKIYVVGGYLLKVTKHIVPNADGSYDIYIVVENVGGARTPDYVYVYDLIPKNFSILNIWVNQSDMLAQKYGGTENYTGFNDNINSSRYNVSYYWALHEIYPGADGDGSWTDGTEINNNQTVVIHYTLNGTGTFYPSDVFIVGIDPTNSLLPTTSPKITAVSGAIENNYEPLLALLTAMVGLGTIIRLKKYAL